MSTANEAETRNRDRAAMVALAAPIPEDQIKTRQGGGGRQLRYIQVPTVIGRLDDALGPENWETEVAMGDRWVRCRLTITLPSGRKLSRDGIGGYPPFGGAGGITEEDAVKGGASDAMKRAASQFGIGLDLYQDAAPASSGGQGQRRPGGGWGPGDGGGDRRPAPQGQRAGGGGNGSYGPPKTGKALYAWAADNDRVKEVNAIGKQLGLGDRMVQWADSEVAEVYGKLNGAGRETGGNGGYDDEDEHSAY